MTYRVMVETLFPWPLEAPKNADLPLASMQDGWPLGGKA